MNLEIWTISEGSFHFGEHGLGQEESRVTFSSDSLFAALAARLAEMQGPDAVNAWLSPFTGFTPPFVLTSAFPRAGKVLFFPLPAGQAFDLAEGQNQAASHKALKQVRFVSQAIFLRLLQGQGLASLVEESLTLQGATLLISSEERKDLPAGILEDAPVWANDRRPRVTIGRSDSKSNLYFTGYTSFAPGCGLWLGVQWIQKEAGQAALLENLFHDLGEAGLGGERSSGFGHAAISSTANLELPGAADSAWVSLSRYLPRQDEMDALRDPRAAYAIQPVGGWLYSPGIKSQRRRTVRMLAEGSVFGPLPHPIPGQVIEVQPTYPGAPALSHKVLRCGFAVPVGIQRR